MDYDDNWPKKYSELSEADQEKLAQEYEDDNWVYDDLIDNQVKEMLEEVGFENPEIEWRLAFCQGDGVSFKADLNQEKLISALAYCGESYETISEFEIMDLMNDRLASFLGILDDEEYEVKLRMFSYRSGCGYPTTYYIEAEAPERFEKQAEKFAETVKSFYDDLCSAIYKMLEAEFWYTHSVEYYAEMAGSNEWMFDENLNIV